MKNMSNNDNNLIVISFIIKISERIWVVKESGVKWQDVETYFGLLDLVTILDHLPPVI